MAETIAVSCGKCKKAMNVPGTLAGKKVRCKGCEAVVAVPAAAARETFKLAEEPKTAEPARMKRPSADDEDDGKMTYEASKTNDEEATRCPFCAKKINPEHRICRHCGFDMIDRKRREQKFVFELTLMDWLNHHLKTIGAFLFILLTVFLMWYCNDNMDDWFKDSFLDMGEKDPTTNKPRYYLPPLFGKVWTFVIGAFLIFYSSKFIYRMIKDNWRPTELRSTGV